MKGSAHQGREEQARLKEKTAREEVEVEENKAIVELFST